MAKELFARGVKKVVPFEQDGSFFYRKAKKHIENNNYINALNYYRKAIEKDPKNQEYSLDLAEVLSEMGYYHESNLILFSLLQETPPRTECYFAMGCNFLGLQEYKKAEHSLKKYMEEDESGFYFEEAQNLLDVLQSQEFYYEYISEIDPQKNKVMEMAAKGKDFLDKGDYKRAVMELEKATSLEPEFIFARNNLALAYFCLGKDDRAIDICLEILEKQPLNVHANCNAALFHFESGDKTKAAEYLEIIKQIKTDDPEELHKITITMCELGQHQNANMLLKRLLQYKPYETQILHYMAISCFNLKKYKTALRYWDKIEKITPNNTISSYYKAYVKRVMDGEEKFLELPYNFQVPYDEIIRRVKKIHDILKLSKNERKNEWKNGDWLISLLRWGLNLNDVLIKKAILSVIASFQDEKAEKLLREFILRKSERAELIEEALILLKQMDAKEPYMAFINNNIVEVKIKRDQVIPVAQNILEEIPEMAVNRLKKQNYDNCEADIYDAWECCLHHWEMTEIPEIRKPEGWAAALELYYRIREDLPVSKKELAAAWNISYTTLMKNYNYIIRLMDNFWGQINL
ncbi:MAG: tetratricopeptide repeat protein [Caldicoprobacterales bacterium]|jgi:tetratricopeptide (TPR) repeat protein